MKFRVALMVLVLAALVAMAVVESPASQAGRGAGPAAAPTGDSFCQAEACYSQGQAVSALFSLHMSADERAALLGLRSDPIVVGPSITWLMAN